MNRKRHLPCIAFLLIGSISTALLGCNQAEHAELQKQLYQLQEQLADSKKKSAALAETNRELELRATEAIESAKLANQKLQSMKDQRELWIGKIQSVTEQTGSLQQQHQQLVNLSKAMSQQVAEVESQLANLAIENVDGQKENDNDKNETLPADGNESASSNDVGETKTVEVSGTSNGDDND